MRIDKKATSRIALDLLRSLKEEELANLLFENANEYRSRRIASLIKSNITNIKSSGDLAELLLLVYRPRRIHPATKTFQALRIAVNDELKNLEQFFAQVLQVLNTWSYCSN